LQFNIKSPESNLLPGEFESNPTSNAWLSQANHQLSVNQQQQQRILLPQQYMADNSSPRAQTAMGQIPSQLYQNQFGAPTTTMLKNKKPVYVAVNPATTNGLLLLLLLSFIALAGTIGTIFIVSALTVIETLQTRANCYLVSVAICHLPVTLLVIPTSAVQIMAGDSFVPEQQLCHYHWLAFEMCLIVNQLTFLAIAADNYIAASTTKAANYAAASISAPNSTTTTSNTVPCVSSTNTSALSSSKLDKCAATAPSKRELDDGCSAPLCCHYDVCCSRARIMALILMIWIAALVLVFQRHQHNFGPSFCPLGTPTSIRSLTLSTGRHPNAQDTRYTSGHIGSHILDSEHKSFSDQLSSGSGSTHSNASNYDISGYQRYNNKHNNLASVLNKSPEHYSNSNSVRQLAGHSNYLQSSLPSSDEHTTAYQSYQSATKSGLVTDRTRTNNHNNNINTTLHNSVQSTTTTTAVLAVIQTPVISVEHQLVVLVGAVLTPTLLSVLLFTRAWFTMKQIKLPPYTPVASTIPPGSASITPLPAAGPVSMSTTPNVPGSSTLIAPTSTNMCLEATQQTTTVASLSPGARDCRDSTYLPQHSSPHAPIEHRFQPLPEHSNNNIRNHHSAGLEPFVSNALNSAVGPPTASSISIPTSAPADTNVATKGLTTKGSVRLSSLQQPLASGHAKIYATSSLCLEQKQAPMAPTAPLLTSVTRLPSTCSPTPSISITQQQQQPSHLVPPSARNLTPSPTSIGGLTALTSCPNSLSTSPQPASSLIADYKDNQKLHSTSHAQLARTISYMTSSFVADDQLLKSNIAVFVFTLFLWSPYLLTSAIVTGRRQLFVALDVSNTLWWILVLNSCSYSYVYASTNRDFREAFNKLFYYCCCKSHVTFQRKGPILRRQLDVDESGNLRIHIIPGLNLYAHRANKEASIHDHHNHHHHNSSSGLGGAALASGGSHTLHGKSDYHSMSVGGGFGGPFYSIVGSSGRANQSSGASSSGAGFGHHSYAHHSSGGRTYTASHSYFGGRSSHSQHVSSSRHATSEL
ncbi:hypothetical protein GZH46_01046, partial [Fragariocoptes setiger]